ncbi:sigma-70 family RNA polymerase sigma factor [Paenibacillus rhizoplanae]
MALDTLSPKERNLIALKFGADLKNTEIARITGISESNVGVILYRSMRKIEIRNRECGRAMRKKKAVQPDFTEQEIQELGRYLASQDFSRESDPAAVLRQVRSRSIQRQQEDDSMKNNQRIRRPVMIAASLLVAAVVSVSFCQTLVCTGNAGAGVEIG